MTQSSGLLFSLSLALLAACGSDEPSSSPEPASDVTTVSDASGPDATASDASPTACPSGHVEGPDGACMAVGIQGCDAMFIDPETGLCDPSLVDCPLGSIPIFGGEDQGCRPVGIQGCDDMFIDPETGLCDPAYVECPPGQIPVFVGDDQGCQVVGIVDCHPDFLDAETGRCEPKEDVCPQGSMAIPTQGCVSLDPPGGCGEGTWGNIEELPGDVHLDVNYTGDDSDGSREKPWTLYGYAIGQVQPGGRVVFAAGDYDKGILVSKSISLVGRCSSMVTLSGTRQGLLGSTVLEIKGDVVAHVSDLTVSGSGFGIVAISGAQASLARLEITGNQGDGVSAVGAGTSVEITDALITSMKLAPDGDRGGGVIAATGASLSLKRSVVSENHSYAAYAYGVGTTLSIDQSWLHATKLNGDGASGVGLLATQGSSVSLAQTHLSENHSMGLYIAGSQTQVNATEVAVVRSLPTPEGYAGSGAQVSGGASLTMIRSRIADNHDAGILIAGGGSQLTLEDSEVSGVTEAHPVSIAAGLSLLEGATASIHRVRLAGNFSGLVVGDDDSQVTATDLWITGAESTPSTHGGYGVLARFGASLTLSRTRIEESALAGLRVFGEGTDVTTTELYVTGRKSPGVHGGGPGLSAVAGGSLSVSRSFVADNYAAGIVSLNPGSSVVVEEVFVSGTNPNADEMFGYGFDVGQEASLSLRRVVARENRVLGLLAMGSGTTVEAEEVWLVGTQPGSDGGAGYGLLARDGASVSLSRSALSDNRIAGLRAFGLGSMVIASEILVTRTEMNLSNGWGMGFSIEDSAEVELSHGYFSENHNVAVAFSQSSGRVSSSLLERTKLSDYPAGDGLLASGAVVDADNIIVRHNARVGVLYNDSEGEISGSWITHNEIGLISQGIHEASVTEDTVVENNAQNLSLDGNLAVPDEKMPLPGSSDGGT